MKIQKQLWILVGGNGAGKSTFYKLYLKGLGIPFVNADNIAKIVYPDTQEDRSYDAAKLAEQIRRDLLMSGSSFCFETVYSHPSKIDFLAEAKALGYEVIMVVIHLENTQLNLARVAERVSEGGHSVPDKKVETRIPRTLKHINTSIPLCDRIQIYDNSFADDPFKRVVTIQNGVITSHVDPLPTWAKELLSSQNL